jgi:hypothetical protein
MAKKSDALELVTKTLELQETHYAANTDFLPPNTIGAVIATLAANSAELIDDDGKKTKIETNILAVKDAKSDKIPKNAVDLIEFKIDDKKIVFPLNLYTEDFQDKLKKIAGKGDIDAHYENRGKTDLDDIAISKQEIVDYYKDTTAYLMQHNPLMKGELAEKAMQIISPPYLAFDEDKKQQYAHLTEQDLEKIMAPKVFASYEQAANNIVKFARREGTVAQEPEREVGARN